MTAKQTEVPTIEETPVAKAVADVKQYGNKDTIYLTLGVSMPGTKKRVPTESVETDADNDVVTVSKTILECDELKAVSKQTADIRAYVRSRCVKPRIIKAYVVPPALVEEDAGVLDDMIKTWWTLVDRAVEVYPSLPEVMSARLNSLYDVGDYPSVEAFAKSFNIEYFFLSSEPATALKGISSELYKKEQKKAEAQFAAMMEDVQIGLYEAAKQNVDYLVERLTDNEEGIGRNGKEVKKRLTATAIEKLKDFFDCLKARNVTGDARLNEIADRAKAILDGKDTEGLRSNEATRDYVKQKMAELAPFIDEAIVAKPGRKMFLQGAVSEESKEAA